MNISALQEFIELSSTDSDDILDVLENTSDLELERYVTVRRSGSYLPVGARLKYTTQELSGFTEIGDVQYPEYETKYHYEIDEWSVYDTLYSSGNDQNPYYPVCPLQWDGLDIIGARRCSKADQIYLVNFITKEGESVRFSTLDGDFKGFNIGELCSGKILWGMVYSVKRLEGGR